MSLDFDLVLEKLVSYDKGKTFAKETECVFSKNITHNLGEMADKAGIYEALWRPYRLKRNWIDTEDHEVENEFDRNNPVYAYEVIKVLEKGLAKLKSKPKYFQKFDSPNGWGLYVNFVPFVEKVLSACKEYSDARIEISR